MKLAGSAESFALLAALHFLFSNFCVLLFFIDSSIHPFVDKFNIYIYIYICIFELELYKFEFERTLFDVVFDSNG
jgi:hypothetical protein